MIKVFNTLSRTKEIFKPLKKNEVSIYCCGVTPYRPPVRDLGCDSPSF